jgi:hypothetical protein
MTEAEILRNLESLRTRFIEHNNNWIRLKTQDEFYWGIDHNSPIRSMYAEGNGTASYLVGSLNTKWVNRGVLLDEYVAEVRKSISPESIYLNIGHAAEKDIRERYPNNYTVSYMIREYWDQWETIKRIEQFLCALEAVGAYPAPSNPMAVIEQYANVLSTNAQLHQGLNENSLRAHIVQRLVDARYQAVSEAHSYQGHADIVVKKATFGGVSVGNQLVAECKIWGGQLALSDALSQLCKYVTGSDGQAALIVFVKEGDFSDICRKASDSLNGHPSARGAYLNNGSSINFNLIPMQNMSQSIPATLLLINLTIPRYTRTMEVKYY